MKEFVDMGRLVTFNTVYQPTTKSRMLQLDISVSKDCDIMALMEKINECVEQHDHIGEV